MRNPSNILNTSRIFIWLASSTFFHISTIYHHTGNETDKNNIQRILFEKSYHTQMTVLRRNSFEFRGESLSSSNLYFLSYVYSQHSCDSVLNNTEKFCTEMILAFHILMRKREG